MTNLAAYCALQAEAQRLDLPHHYVTDITVHDHAILARRDAPASFGWILTTCGTYFLRPGAFDALPTAQYHRCNPDARYYWFADGKLVAATLEQVAANLAVG